MQVEDAERALLAAAVLSSNGLLRRICCQEVSAMLHYCPTPLAALMRVQATTALSGSSCNAFAVA